MHFVHVLQDAFHQVSHRHTNGPRSVALQLDNLIGPAAQITNDKKKNVIFLSC